MGFGGSVAAMMQSIKLNKAQLKNSKSYFDKNTSYEKTYGDFLDHKKMTPEQFKIFKHKLIQEKRENQKRFIITMSSIVLLVISITSILLFT